MKSQLRVAFDLDGVLADFASAYNQIAKGLFPDWSGSDAVLSEVPPDEDPAAAGQGSDPLRRLSRRDRDAIWKQLRSTPNFWLTLDPIDPDAIPLLQERSSHFGWDMFFVTQRPPTVGGSVQSQTQRWLVEHGFELPSVIVHSGSRGRLAAALELDHLVDGHYPALRRCTQCLRSYADTGERRAR